MTEALAKRDEVGLAPKLTDESIARIVENMQQWEKFKKAAVGQKDKTHFGENEYIEKSGWVKLRMAMNVSFEIMDDGQRIPGRDSEGDYYTWKFKGRATSPNGVYIQMDGACSSRDEFFSMKRDEDGNQVRRASSEIDEKDIIATAQTNAFVRCMSFLMGFGEVGADEMRGKQFAKKAATFPFGDFKGQEPSAPSLADLHKILPFWEKQASDESNKFAANNKKLLAAIKEAIAEKTAKPESPARPTDDQSAHPGVEGAAATPAGDVPPTTGEPTPTERLLIRIQEHLESGKLTKAALTSYTHKNFCDKAHKEPVCDDARKLNLLQLQAVSAWLTMI